MTLTVTKAPTKSSEEEKITVSPLILESAALEYALGNYRTPSKETKFCTTHTIQRVVIKGLPISTDLDDFLEDMRAQDIVHGMFSSTFQ